MTAKTGQIGKIGLIESLSDGGNLVVAEGYMWETERRGYLQFGSFLPEVVIEKPSMIKALHEEFVYCGSDVVEAFTYYAYRQQLQRLGKENIVEKLNRDALRIAREVADDNDKLMAGNISNTPICVPNDSAAHQQIYDMYKEQIVWAVQGGADYIIGETHSSVGEAEIALKAIKEHGQGLPAVITMAVYFPDRTVDDVPATEACRRLEAQGAAVVGLNCSRGPGTIMPLIKQIKTAVSCPVACLPVPFRTTEKEMTYFSLTDGWSGEKVWAADLDCVRCSRSDIRKFAQDAKQAGIQYVGLCCGNSPNLTREIAEVYGKNPPASKYSYDMKKSAIFGSDNSQFDNSLRKLRYMTGEER